jgi:hypothetical protein
MLPSEDAEIRPRPSPGGGDDPGRHPTCVNNGGSLGNCLTAGEGPEAVGGGGSTSLGPAREEVLRSIISFLLDPCEDFRGRLVCLLGPSGWGKTEMLRRLERSIQTQGLAPLFFEAEPPPGGSLLRHLARWLLARLAPTGGPKEELPDLGESLAGIWPRVAELLHRDPAGKVPLLFLDGLEEFEPTALFRNFEWLKTLLAAPSRIVVTCTPGPLAEELVSLSGVPVRVVELPPWEASAACNHVRWIWRKSLGELPNRLWELLTEKQNSLSQPAWQLPLWLTLAGEYLVGKAATISGAVDTGSRRSELPPEQEANLYEEAARLPPEVEPLCWHILGECERLLGRGWVHASLGLIAVSRRGLRESDLAALVPKTSRLLDPGTGKRAWEPDSWRRFLECLPGWFQQRTPEGTWDFCHKLLRAAVRNRYLRDIQLTERLHTFVAYHLRTMTEDDMLRQNELIFHLASGDDRARAALHLTSNLSPREKRATLLALETFVLVRAGEVPNPAVSWLVSLLLEPGLKPEDAASLCAFLYQEFLPWLGSQLDSASSRRILEAARQKMDELLRHHPEKADWRTQLEQINNVLGVPS